MNSSAYFHMRASGPPNARLAIVTAGLRDLAEFAIITSSGRWDEALISAVPQTDPGRRGNRIVLKGEMPNPEAPPPGCPFHPRCPKAMAACRTTPPPETDIGAPGAPHLVRCHLY